VQLTYVIETMRPLPVETISGVLSFVQGIALIRGIATPVVDLGAVLGTPNEAAEQFVTLRVGDKQVAPRSVRPPTEDSVSSWASDIRKCFAAGAAPIILASHASFGEANG
jgi:hypothetical protein